MLRYTLQQDIAKKHLTPEEMFPTGIMTKVVVYGTCDRTMNEEFPSGQDMGTSDSVPKCWICGDDATTGEHKSKRSDLRAVFGAPTQAAPLYLHDQKKKNRPVKSLNAKILKSSSRICPKCNNARTQPHDRAWEKLSESLRTHTPVISPGVIVRVNRIFRYDTHREMLNVHLYFLKLFGCHIVEGALPIAIKDFSAAILQEKAHPHVYLKFGCFLSGGSNTMIGMSNLEADVHASSGICAFAAWFYCLDRFAVNVMFAADGERREGLINAWHPRLGTSKLVMANFES